MNLFIVESPGKRATIQKYLDDIYGAQTFLVAATCGHFCGLPAMDGQAFADVVNPTTWDESWVIHKNDVYTSLKRLIDRAERVYVATDADREGEAIAWHVMRTFRLDERRTRRVRYIEITKASLKAAIDNPSPLNLNLVAAQRARQVLDYEFGMELSRPLWRFGCKSAGRVQSAAVRLIVDRENAIRAFRSQTYATITATFAGPIVASLHTSSPVPLPGEFIKNGDADVNDEEPADTDHVDESPSPSKYRLLRFADLTVANDLSTKTMMAPKVLADIAKTTSVRKPPAPFITSTLLQTASQVLRLHAKKVTSIAQALFESGLVTYIRTDSPALAEEAIAEIRAVLSDKHPHLLPKEPQRYAAKANAQGAHEAIRPTHMSESPAALAGLSREERAVYDLIWNQTLACQAKSAVLQKTTMTISIGGHPQLAFIARGTVVLEHGFLALQKTPPSTSLLPDLPRGHEFRGPAKYTMDQGATKPPARFTEAKLAKYLEKHGIGRPATYATVMSSIVDREYIEVTNEKTRELAPTPLGHTSDNLLRASFDTLTRSEFTAQIERSFDSIEAGKLTRQLFLTTFDTGLRKMLASSAQRLEAFAKEYPELDHDAVVQDDKPCRKCGGIRDLRHARLGRMAACRSCAHVDLVVPKERSKSACHLDAKHGLMAKLTAKGSSTPFYKCLACDYTSSTEAPPPPCPLCKAPTARRKNAAGEHFWGCTQFFKTGCRGVAQPPAETSKKPRARRTQRSKKPMRRRQKSIGVAK
jgi:DNA topoisomerase-1